jgi:hypothetical protein
MSKVKKYKAVVSSKTINANDTWNSDGCSGYSIHNAGNVNVTIDGIRILKPRETWEGPNFHPEVGYHNKHKIDFDRLNAPTFKTPQGGTEPPTTVIAPGDPAPDRDNRVIIDRIDVE